MNVKRKKLNFINSKIRVFTKFRTDEFRIKDVALQHFTSVLHIIQWKIRIHLYLLETQVKKFWNQKQPKCAVSSRTGFCVHLSIFWVKKTRKRTRVSKFVVPFFNVKRTKLKTLRFLLGSSNGMWWDNRIQIVTLYRNSCTCTTLRCGPTVTAVRTGVQYLVSTQLQRVSLHCLFTSVYSYVTNNVHWATCCV